MKFNLKYISSLSVFYMLLSCQAQKRSIDVGQLDVEGRSNLIGLQEQHPRLSWKIASPGQKSILQTAYQIFVSASEDGALSGKAEIWNSGKVMSDSSIHIRFAGKALSSHKNFYWKVKVWTNKGDSATSKVNHWKMAMQSDQEWNADWIGLDTFSKQDAPRRIQTR
ncbi:MAG: hypothetical protein EOO04_31955, partial [Chitinophagaceae bacterium]